MIFVEIDSASSGSLNVQIYIIEISRVFINVTPNNGFQFSDLAIFELSYAKAYFTRPYSCFTGDTYGCMMESLKSLHKGESLSPYCLKQSLDYRIR